MGLKLKLNPAGPSNAPSPAVSTSAAPSPAGSRGAAAGKRKRTKESFVVSDSDDALQGSDDENLDEAYRSPVDSADEEPLSDFGDEEDEEGEVVANKGSTRKKAAGSKKGKGKKGTKDGAILKPTQHNAYAGSRDMVTSAFSDAADYSGLPLKHDHAFRPLYISPYTRTIILESFHSLAPQAQDFLIAIAEPVSRPAHLHEYKLTPHSLYAAVSVGLQTEDIIEVLNRLSKVPVPTELTDFIRERTSSVGKVKLVLKHNRYFVESSHPETLRLLLKDPIISAARVTPEDAARNVEAASGAQQTGEGVTVEQLGRDKAPRRAGLVIPGTKGARQADSNQQKAAGEAVQENKDPAQADYELFSAVVGLDREDELDEDESVHSFEIKGEEIEAVKRQAVVLEYPMLEEYDFRNDFVNANLEMDLKPSTMIRPYQEKSLSKMFGNGRARSGIIVLPCGAGKTLVGITAACTIKKSVLVLCTSSVSVLQWRQEFLKWSTVQDRQIAVFTSDQKEKFLGDSGIVVSTYSMVANRTKRSHDAAKMMDFLTSREWGFILLDEVHVVPAAMFRRVVTTIKAHAKLGLTATLVREDDKIDDLNFLIGPKLYEANWMDLAKDGHIANVQCAEVWCHMTPEFYREYLREKSRKRMLLYAMNPRKFQACQFLINYHESRGDKIIVFSDNVFALEAYARKLRKLFIHGGTPSQERVRILQNFQHNPLVNCIFLSKVGDTSIDLPEATCLIQISSHFGSRRQEAQRLGRILRAKRRNDEGFNAFFYSLVSRDTEEMFYSTKRQQFLIDQGYAFKVITHLDGIESMQDLVYPSKKEQIELLGSVLLASETDAEIGKDIAGHADDLSGSIASKNVGGPLAKKRADGASQAKRVQGNLSALSGAAEMSYVETNRSANRQLQKEQGGRNKHSFFKKREAMQKEKRKMQQGGS